MIVTDHALDAVLCLVAALDYVNGEVVQPPSAELDRVRQEGWIWFRPPFEATDQAVSTRPVQPL